MKASLILDVKIIGACDAVVGVNVKFLVAYEISLLEILRQKCRTAISCLCIEQNGRWFYIAYRSTLNTTISCPSLSFLLQTIVALLYLLPVLPAMMVGQIGLFLCFILLTLLPQFIILITLAHELVGGFFPHISTFLPNLLDYN